MLIVLTASSDSPEVLSEYVELTSGAGVTPPVLQPNNLLSASGVLVLVLPRRRKAVARVDDLVLKKESRVLDFQLQRRRIARSLVASKDVLCNVSVAVSLVAVRHCGCSVIHEPGRDETTHRQTDAFIVLPEAESLENSPERSSAYIPY